MSENIHFHAILQLDRKHPHLCHYPARLKTSTYLPFSSFTENVAGRLRLSICVYRTVRNDLNYTIYTCVESRLVSTQIIDLCLNGRGARTINHAEAIGPASTWTHVLCAFTDSTLWTALTSLASCVGAHTGLAATETGLCFSLKGCNHHPFTTQSLADLLVESAVDQTHTHTQTHTCSSAHRQLRCPCTKQEQT